MAKYRETEAEAGQGLLLEVNLKEQLLPGTFEYMLDKIVDTKIDMRMFDKNYKNDETGARAVPPSALLKLIIYGYKKGQNSSRKLEALNEHNIIAKALTRDMRIHWTTIANFVSKNGRDFKDVFVRVLMYCNELELIGGTDYAIDGLRLPSNASMEMSGTKEQLGKRLEVYKRMAEKHMKRHEKKDGREENDEVAQRRYEQRQKRLNRQIGKIESFLDAMEAKKGKEEQEIQSNVTDNESAMIHSKKGFIQGYIGIAVSDKKSQIIVSAEAAGSANEGEHLAGMLDQQAENLEEAGVAALGEGRHANLMGDSNYFSEENLAACAARGIEAIIPNGQLRRQTNEEGEKRYGVDDFVWSGEGGCYECPQGKKLCGKGKIKIKNNEYSVYQASLTDCRTCPNLAKCIWSKKGKSKINQGKKLMIPDGDGQRGLCREMRKKLETEEYREKYAYRIQIVEPVFANMGYCMGLNRFTLRGKEKVNGQWQLYCIVHNLSKCLNGFNAGLKGA
jgi:transposase